MSYFYCLCMRELIKFGFGLKACFLYQAGEVNMYFIKNRKGLLKHLFMRSFTCHLLFTIFQNIERVFGHVSTSLLPISAPEVFFSPWLFNLKGRLHFQMLFQIPYLKIHLSSTSCEHHLKGIYFRRDQNLTFRLVVSFLCRS